MTTAPTRKYNPGFLTDDELVASFCVRTHEFESLIESLSACTGESNQHQIVIGPRGSGKTSLLLRVAAEVRRDADLAAGFFPIVFAEESYEVSTAGEFWLECLARLAIQAPEREDAPNLHTTLADLRTIHDDRTLGERCLAALLDFADREGKRLVLIVENLNMMFRDMMDRDAGWRLRKILQNEPRIILLASATSRFDEIDQPDHALYDQFRVLTLRPLDTAECAALWETVAGQSRPKNTIRSLEILTGGSPRLLAIVARFGAGLSFRELMDSLFDLVDDHTEYFKSHLESLPAQERRVYLALADIWKPALTKEVAERARLETSKCSAQLARLIERGVVRLDGGSARRKQYYLSERMYNIYYLLRRGQDRLIEVLIRFMASYYSPGELQEIGIRIAREAEDVAPEMRSLYQSASTKLVAMSAREEPLEEIQAVRSFVGDEKVVVARAFFKRGRALWSHSQYEAALATFDELLRRFGETEAPALLATVAKALVSKGAVLAALNRQEEALAACDEVLYRFADSDAPEFLEQIASALVNRGVVLATLKRREEALAACDELLHRLADSDVPRFLELVARAFVTKGAALVALNRWEEALAASNEVLFRFAESEVPELLEQVAKALLTKGVALGKLERLEEELAAYNEVMRRFGDGETEELRATVANALVNRGVTLGALNRPAGGLAACDEVLDRFIDSDAPELREQVARAFVAKGVALVALDRWKEALATCTEMLSRLGDSEESELLVHVARALVNKGVALCLLNRPEEALATCDEVLTRFGTTEVPEILERVGSALVNKGVLLGALNRKEEALAAYDEVLSRFGASETPVGLGQVARALANQTILLAELNRPTEAGDIAAMLVILPKLDSPERNAVRALMAFSIDHGLERLHELIEASPAAELLRPLTTALEREIGLDPRVPEEISEVAEDIRRDLAEMREARRT